MWLPWTVNAEFLGGYAGAALLCATLTQWLSSPGLEMYSDILCWAVLPLLIRFQKRLEDGSLLGPSVRGESNALSSPSSSQWVFATAITVLSLIKMEAGAVQFSPILTPLLLATQRYIGSASKVPASPFFLSTSSAWGATIISLFIIFVFSDWDIQISLFSIALVAALFTVHAALLPKSGTFLRLSSINFERAIRPLSIRIVILLFSMLCISTILTGLFRVNPIHILLLGLLKTLSWYFTAKVAHSTSWVIATTITTFSIASTSNLPSKASDTQAATWVLAAVIALGQVISSLPKQTKYKSLLWTFSLISFLPFLRNIWMIRDTQRSAKVFGPEQEHPVEALVRNGNHHFQNLLHRQSKSYQQAVTEYQRRYGVKPPSGFKNWYEFAVSRQSPIIDDFDVIYQAISPLWRLSGQQVHEIVDQVYYVPKSEMWFCVYYGAYAQTRCTHPDRFYDRHIEYQFDRLLWGFNGVLPDIKFLFNHLDEPRILVPIGEVEMADSHPLFNVTNMSKQPVWEEVTKFCASRKKPGTTEEVQIPIEASDIPFVTNRSSAVDLCEHPEYRNMHGLFMSPATFSLVEGLVPALSTGSPSTMGDILFPSPAYLEEEFTYDDTREISWEEKKNNLYWAGSTTGAFASDASWPSYHRQRFVGLVQNTERQQYYYLRLVRGTIQRVASSFLNGRLFDVAFTRIFQCESKYCRDQATTFKVGGWADKDKALQSRLVFDLDGNGISGRYYKLLASKSAPLKQTLLREWHDDRLVPWVHYIPVSQSLEELPELVLYLTSTESGQQRARDIAEQGRDWFFKALREADMSVYTYRLLLELARLQDPNRPAGFPSLV